MSGQETHDGRCESRFIIPAGGWTRCGCASRSTPCPCCGGRDGEHRRMPSVEKVAEVLDVLDARRGDAFMAWTHDTDPATARTPPPEVTNTDRAERVVALWGAP